MNVNTNFQLEATPERIFAVLKLIEFSKYTKDEIKKLVHPNNEKGTAVDVVLNYIRQCEWVYVNENQEYVLNIDSAYIKDIQCFRKMINKHLFEGDKTWYFEFTKWYMSQDEHILQYTLKDIKGIVPASLVDNSEKSMNYWRLWSSFLGFGNLQKVGVNSRFTPNPYVRIEDILAIDQQLERNVSISFKEFASWLCNVCPELRDCIQGNNISTFLSLALRVMYDHEAIDLEYHQDSTNVWYLTTSNSHEITGKVTHIAIKGGK